MKTSLHISGDLTSATIRGDNFAAEVNADRAIIEDGIMTSVKTYEQLCALDELTLPWNMAVVVELSKEFRKEREWGV